MAVAPNDARPRSTARSALPVASGILAGGLALSVLYATTGVGLPCPFRALTGWDCPLCGGTRMGEALLHGDLGSAARANPVALVAVAVLALLTVLWTVELLGGPAVRAPRPLARRLRRVPAAIWLVLGAAAALAYAVLRNLG
ncbi:MAG TPA: DUF2752 domain-containing protein [Propionibacteriaceae bacterium]|nr:DUF2752 domain-containing protein [Propionibacteriaceae bacterium]